MISKIILRPSDIKPTSKNLKVLGVLNPGAARLENKKIILYIRIIEQLKEFQDERYFYSPRAKGKEKYEIVIDKFAKSSAKAVDEVAITFKNNTKRLNYISHLRKVILNKKGNKIISIDNKPTIYGLKNDSELGVEDPRITKIKDTYYMTYVGLSRKENISTYLAESKDCIKWKRLGIIFGEQDKDVVLFPEKIKNKYVCFDRPEGNFEFSAPHIWVVYSKDLIYWGKPTPISLSKHGFFSRSGAGPPPIKTKKGWLLIFHGVTPQHQKGFWCSIKKTLGMPIEQGPDSYAVWAALFDLQNPGKIIARSHCPIMYPLKKSFEDKMVVFPTGLVETKNKKNLLVYSGAGDIYISLRKIPLKKILRTLRPIQI